MYRFKGYPSYGLYMKLEHFPLRDITQILNPCHTNIFANFLILSRTYSVSKFPLEGSWFRADLTDMTPVTTCEDIMSKLPNITHKEYIELLTTRYDIIKPQAGEDVCSNIELVYVIADQTRNGYNTKIINIMEANNFLSIASKLFSVLGEMNNNQDDDDDDGCSLSDISQEAPDDGLTLDDLDLGEVTYVDICEDEGLTLEDLNIH